MSGLFYILWDRLKFFLGAFWEHFYPSACTACNDFNNIHTMHKTDEKRVAENIPNDFNRLSEVMIQQGK
jgi:hypothetical protein